MKAAETTAPIFYTVAECAAQIGVSQETVIRWIEEGHLLSFVPPGRRIGDGLRGPKGLKIMRDNWEAFIRARTMTGRPSTAATSAPSQASTPTGQAIGPNRVTKLAGRRPRGPGY
jgi:excisionase family DNA binding protein